MKITGSMDRHYENMGEKQLTLAEKWKIDVEAYKKGAVNKTSAPQCIKCRYVKKGDALHCNVYKEERKPRYVMFPHKECPSFCSDDILEVNVSDVKCDKIYGGFFGFCVGDMLGVPVEFSTRSERENDPVEELRAYGTYHQTFGTWSDDTSLMLCLIDALNVGFSQEKLKENMIYFYTRGKFTPHGEVFDIGNATRDAIHNMIQGIPPVDCGGKREKDNGNGSLMRILPLAFVSKSYTDEELIKLVENVSSFTHAHDRSKFACIFYVKLAAELFVGKEKMEAFDSAIGFVDKNCGKKYADERKNFETILNKDIIYTEKSRIRSTGYVIDTLEAVLWLFFHTESYRDVVLNAVNLGGDTDTIAALAGGIAGIYYGFRSIPDNWVQNICRKHEISDMILTFCCSVFQNGTEECK